MGRCPYFEGCGDVPLQSIKYCHDPWLSGMHNCHKAMLLCIVLEKWPKYLIVLIRLLSEGCPLARYLEVGLGKWDRDCRSMTVCDVLADGSEYP